MATISKWTPFGVALDITAAGGTVTRTSATTFTVAISASWETYYSGAKTNYGMSASSGGITKVISSFGTSRSSGSGSFTGTYSISGNGSATKTITVTFRNFNDDNDDSATKNVTFNVTVPAWTSYTVKYNANGGSGAPGNQTKWKGQTLTLSSTKPTRTGHSFLGWSTSSSATSATYSAGGSYTTDAATTLYAVWKANTYTVKYNANGGTGAPANQTKTYGVALTLASAKPTRTNYNFKGWSASSTATTATYSAGGSYTNNAAITLYAVWELAYMKPSLTDITVERCDKDGITTDDGTYAIVTFGWSTYKTATNAVITWTSSDNVTDSTTVALSGTSGTLTEVIGSGDFNTDLTYSVTISLYDSGGTTTISKTLSGFHFPIDFLNGEIGVGVAIGKPAEKKDTLDVALTAEFRKSVNIQGNRYSLSTTGTSGESGYIKMASIAIGKASANWPITFIFSQRKAATTMTVHALFSSTETTSSVDSITYEGSNYGAFLCQSSDMIWDLYVQKSTANDTVTLQDWWMSKAMESRVEVTFLTDLVSTLPTPYYRATPAKLQSLVDFIYPVNSIYISYSHVNPGTMFGGTWERITNAFLWGCDSSGTIGQTGGEKTHTLTTNELPSHSHGAVYSGNATGTKNLPWLSTGVLGTGDKIAYSTIETGGGAAHNNMPPYVQVSIWRRTA